MKIRKRIKDKGFIGNIVSLFKMGMQYMNLVIGIVNSALLFRLAFPDIALEYIIFLVSPMAIIFTVGIGYYLDKTDINSIDHIKLTERAHRYLSLADIKNQDFHMIGYDHIIRSISKMSAVKDKYLKPEYRKRDLYQDYEKYLKKWKKL